MRGRANVGILRDSSSSAPTGYGRNDIPRYGDGDADCRGAFRPSQ